jgi:spore germination cell wall hydrolase CwlJ-like protein
MIDITAAVIYAEASPICSYQERYLVASVIKNRIKNPAFGGGKLFSMEDVVRQKGAFSCLWSPGNTNWQDLIKGRYKKPVFKETVILAAGEFIPESGIVYYHDKSIEKPRSWDNKYWKTIRAIETEHFIFYKIVAAT